MLTVRNLTLALLVAASATPAGALEMTERQVKIGPELTIPAARTAAEALFKLDAAGSEPILLVIDVRSGFAPAAMVVVDAVAALRSKVYAVIHSEAFGPGAVVAVFCARRFMFPHASMLFSPLLYESEKTMKESPPLPVEAANAHIDRIYQAVGKQIGMSADELKKKSQANWFLTAEEAKKAGLVDEVVSQVTWQELVTETVEIKKTSTLTEKRPLPAVKEPTR